MSRPRPGLATTIAGLIACLLAGASALASEWIMVPAESTLKFIAEQQGAKFEGQFESFSAAFTFDARHPAEGGLRGTIDTASVNTFNQERDDYLRSADWFDSARWPQAIFETISIEPADDGAWLANASLSLRDVTRPVKMTFSFTPPEGNTPGRLTGAVELLRLEFGVGQGVWTNTEWVGDAVRVEVDLSLRRPDAEPLLQP